MADLIVAETTCDGKKKMYELMGESRPMYVIELPHKSGRAESLLYWHQQLIAFKSELQRRFSVTITDNALRGAIRLMNRERGLRRRLASLMQRAAPPLSGRQLLDFKSSISGIDADLIMYESACSRYEAARDDHSMKDRVRVLMTGVPTVHGAERIVDLIESTGGLIVCMENCTGLKPILDDVDESAPDPLLALAEKYYHLPCSVMTPNAGRSDVLRRLAAEYRPQCVIELVWHACLTYDVESHQTRRFVEQELRLPYLKIDTDYSASDSPRIQVRLEALFETIRNKEVTV